VKPDSQGHQARADPKGKPMARSPREKMNSLIVTLLIPGEPMQKQLANSRGEIVRRLRLVMANKLT